MKTIPSLTGKVAVITGASRGVGAGIATLLGEQVRRLCDGADDGLKAWDNSRTIVR